MEIKPTRIPTVEQIEILTCDAVSLILNGATCPVADRIRLTIADYLTDLDRLIAEIEGRNHN